MALRSVGKCTQITTVYKICTRADWLAAEAVGAFDGSGDDLRDGFIHLSTGEQVEGTIARHFADVDELMILAVEADRLGNSLIWEKSRGGGMFPHLGAPLALNLVAWVQPLARQTDGSRVLPVLD